MTRKKVIQKLFNQVSELTNYDTTPTLNTDRNDANHDYYVKDWLKLDNAPIYGGYNIRIVLTTTGETGFDGLTRRSPAEMESYLRGLIKGLTYNKTN